MKALLKSGRPAEVLLVEDNGGHAELARIALERVNHAVNFHLAVDGEECLAFLRKGGKYTKVPAPDLILLDLNMPRMSGFDVLAEVNRDPELRHLPIVVLTSSDSEKDVLSAYQLRCNSYVVKPMGFNSLQASLESLLNFWFTLAALPSAGSRTGAS